MNELVVKQEVKKYIPQIKTIVGQDEKKASIYASALVQMAMNKNLQNVTPESVIKTGMEIVQLGLNPNPNFGYAYVVPYGKEAQLQIGYKGWITLAYRAGWQVRAVPVYSVDDFNIEFNGLEDKITFKPNLEDRNEDDGAWVYNHLRGVIVYAKDKHGNIFSDFVSFKKLEQLRTKSPNQKKGQLSHIWLEWAEEMYKAKALKYVITRLPIDDTIEAASIAEDRVYYKESPIDTASKEIKISLDDAEDKDALDTTIEEPQQQPTLKELQEQLQEAKEQKDVNAYTEIMNKIKAIKNANS